MALTDIVTSEGNSSVAARGNGGTVSDALSRQAISLSRFLTSPAVGDVKTGVAYGRQGTELTGTYAAVGGSGVSRGRLTNA